jgi:hypothetical protein
MNRKFFVAALAFIALTTITARNSHAQSSCPNTMSFGVHTNQGVDKSLQSQLEVTYFTTDDPNVFLTEQAGISRSASFMHIDTNQFVARLSQLEKQGVASIRKQQSSTSWLGEMAELNLERKVVNADAKMVNAGYSTSGNSEFNALERKTEISVNKGSSLDGGYYRVGILSWYVDGNSVGGMKVVDYDASVLMKPGDTTIFKLRSDYEVARSGATRNYVAVTMRGVGNMGTVASR